MIPYKLLDWVKKYLYEVNPNKIIWTSLSKNKNAINILEKNIDKINWYWLSLNENAIHILENNIDKIYWYNLCLE